MSSIRFLNILIIFMLYLGTRGYKVLANEEIKENIIMKFCHASFTQEVHNAGKKPPSGMATYTCNCFFNQVNLGYSIDSAEQTCKNDASKIYKLEEL